MAGWGEGGGDGSWGSGGRGASLTRSPSDYRRDLNHPSCDQWLKPSTVAEAARGPLAAVTASQAGLTAGPNLLNLNHPRPAPGRTLALAPDMAA